MARDATNQRDNNIAINLERVGFSAMFGATTVLPPILVFVLFYIIIYLFIKRCVKQQVEFRIELIIFDTKDSSTMSFHSKQITIHIQQKRINNGPTGCFDGRLPSIFRSFPADVNISVVSCCYGPVREAKGIFSVT